MPEPAATTPSRVTLPLLDLVQQQAFDEDYLAAAERRGRAGDETGPGTGHPRRVAAVAIAVFGIMASTAAVQTQRNASVQDEGRAGLVARIEDQRARSARLQDRIAGLREGNAARERTVLELSSDAQALSAPLQRLRVRTGFVAVRGPGVSVLVDDEPTGNPDGVVQDEDLALLVDGLWTSGAEAVAVNGQRLTALSAIRTSGIAIEVNGVGIAPPYSVQAIGDPRTLQADFFDTSSGLAFNDLSRRYGFEFTLQNEEELTLPPGPPGFTFLRFAEQESAGGQDLPKTEGRDT